MLASRKSYAVVGMRQRGSAENAANRRKAKDCKVGRGVIKRRAEAGVWLQRFSKRRVPHDYHSRHFSSGAHRYSREETKKQAQETIAFEKSAVAGSHSLY